MDQEQSTRLSTFLEMVPDPRKRRGKRYDWGFLLSVICFGLASGQKTIWAIAEWAQWRGTELLKGFQPSYARIPSASTLYRAMREVDLDALEQIMGAYGKSVSDWITNHDETQEPRSRWRGVAVDGKELRGAGKHGPKVHLVSLVTHQQGVTLSQERVAEKAYEPHALEHMLERLDIADQVITLDALYTHKDMARRLVDHGSHYFMMVKGNQPQLREDIAHLFAERPSPGEARWECSSCEKAHGRIERWQVLSSETLNTFLDWPQVGQVVQRTCTQARSLKSEPSTNTSWAITSLTHAQASVDELAALWREHWVIENRVHYVRDETLGEDRGQIAKGHAPQALASLRNAVLTALRSRGWSRIAQALRYHAANIQCSTLLLTGALT